VPRFNQEDKELINKIEEQMIAGDPKAKKNMVPKIKEEYKGEAYESEDEYADPD